MYFPAQEPSESSITGLHSSIFLIAPFTETVTKLCDSKREQHIFLREHLFKGVLSFQCFGSINGTFSFQTCKTSEIICISTYKKRNKTFRTPSFQKNYSQEPTRTASASKTWIKMLIWILLSGFVNWYPNYTAQTNMKPIQNSRKTFLNPPNRYAH